MDVWVDAVVDDEDEGKQGGGEEETLEQPRI
jgi:hypothetical protein